MSIPIPPTGFHYAWTQNLCLVCSRCAAIVSESAKHTDWHEEVDDQ